MRADQRGDQARDEQHVERVEAADRGGPELRSGPQEVRQVGADDRPRGVDVHGHHGGPEGALVERQQVAGQAHHQREHQQHHADHPVQLARVLVRAEEEGPAHVQEDQDDHHRRAPLVHAAHELAEEDLVGDVRGRLVGARGVGLVVHRQEDAGDRLREEGEHRGRAERVEPVGALGHLAVEEAAQEGRGAGALVEPADAVAAPSTACSFGGRLGGALRRRSSAVAVVTGALWRGGAGPRGAGELHVVGLPGRGTARARPGGSTGSRGREAARSELSEKRSPISTRPLDHARVEAVERAHRRAALDLALEAVDAAVAGADELGEAWM